MWNERLTNPAPLTPAEHRHAAQSADAAQLATAAFDSWEAPAAPTEPAGHYDPFSDDE